MSRILIRGGRVLDPSIDHDDVADVLIEDGKIVACDRNIEAEHCRVIDAEGLWVSPGFVVVKRTIPDHPNRAHQDEMLREEGRVALRLQHDNLVDTYALDELDGHPLLIMEYLAGRSMAQVLGAAKRKK